MSGAHSAKRSAAAELHWNRAWAAFVFGAIAVIALALIAFVLSTQRGAKPNAGPPMLLTQVPGTTSSSAHAPRTSASSSASRRSHPATTPTARRSPTAAHTTAAGTTSASVVAHPSRPAAGRPAGPCRSSAPCAVTGSGNLAAALDAYRRAHGRAPAAAVVTPAAQQCAVTGGDGTSCADPFAVAREAQLSGQAAIRDIGSGTGNFLLDPALRAVEVGWAYDPPTRQYVCVLIARA